MAAARLLPLLLEPNDGPQHLHALGQDLRPRMTIPRPPPEPHEHRHQGIGLQHRQLLTRRVFCRLFFFTSNTANSCAL